MKFKTSQKGISIFITFFVLTIILGIVLGLSAILISEIKIIREMGESVISFFAADSGIEKTFFYDRKKIPERRVISTSPEGEPIIVIQRGKRGICDICTPNVCLDCRSIQCSGTDCNPYSCKNCQIDFSTNLTNKKYEIKAIVDPAGETTIKSYGNYLGTKRAIKLTYLSEGGAGGPTEGPNIINASISSRSVAPGIEITITTDVSDSSGVASVSAEIQKPDEVRFDSVSLTLSSGDKYTGTYTGSWTGSEEGVYFVDINACDTGGNCSEAENI